MKLAPISCVREIRHAHMFCGIGVGARGFNLAAPRVGPVQGKFVCVGGIDVDPGAILNFERMTGCKGTVLDLFNREQYEAFHGREPPAGWREATPADIRAAYGPKRPDVVFLSAPCKGFSGLLSSTQSKTDKYQALNGLTLRGIWLMLEAYKDDPIPIILFENVPRILTRGKWLLDQITALVRAAGYSVNLDTHDCGVIGNLAQSRKRALMIARHMELIPPFVYQPKHHRLRGVGEVIGKLPLPGDPIAGPMHRVPSLQWKTWVRLALVPAGKDWRALNELAVVDGNLRDFGIVPEVPLRENALGVNAWSDTAPVITTHRAPGQGRFSVADPRPAIEQHHTSLGVIAWERPSGTISTRGFPLNGAYSVADPRHAGGDRASTYGARAWSAPAGTVQGESFPTNGAFSVADPRYSAGAQDAVLGVQFWSAATGTVQAKNGPTNGAFSVADPRFDGHPRSVQLGVRPWTKPAPCVKGDVSVGTGPYAVSDPRLHRIAHSNIYRVVAFDQASIAVTMSRDVAVSDPRLLGKPRFNNVYRIVPFGEASPAVAGPGGPAGGIAVADPRMGGRDYVTTKYKVTPFDRSSRAVIGASTTGDGAFAVADPRGPHEADKLHGKYPVNGWTQETRAVIAGRDNGAFAVADPRALAPDRPHYQTGGHYGVVAWGQTGYAVSGSACHDNGFNSVADPREAELEPAAIALPKPDDRLVCRIIALDGTWHRPFTTLDLASLQSLFDPEELFYQDGDGVWRCRQNFDLVGGSDVMKREWIGNAVPGAAATGMAETIGETILLAEQGETFFLSSREIWVKPGALALAVNNDQPIFTMDAGA
jgi:site-specific DNA-cytosine methylase